MGSSATRAVTVSLAVAVSLFVGACGDDDTTGAASDNGTVPAGGSVEVTLQEFAVSAVPGTIGAGDVTFEVTNDGPEDVHEFVIIRTDLAATDLPVDDQGAVDESGTGMEVVDEIEDIEVGDTASVTATLEAGAYVLICNILQEEDDGTMEAHYSEGMRTGFTVS